MLNSVKLPMKTSDGTGTARAATKVRNINGYPLSYVAVSKGMQCRQNVCNFFI